MQDKLIMVSGSIITNCQLSTKMIEGIHIFLVWRESWQGVESLLSQGVHILLCCCIMFGTEAESAIWCKILVLFSKAVIFHLFESIQVAFFSLRIFVSVLKVKKYVLSSSCFFVLGVLEGLLRLGVWVGLSCLWCEDELLISVGFSFLRRMRNVHCKKIFFAKMQGLYWV